MPRGLCPITIFMIRGVKSTKVAQVYPVRDDIPVLLVQRICTVYADSLCHWTLQVQDKEHMFSR